MKQADFIPRPGLVLVKEEPKTQRTRGGIHLPDNMEEDSSVNKGTLVDNGGYVIFFDYDSTKIQFDDEEGPLLLIEKEKILGGDAKALEILAFEHEEDR